MNWKRLIALVLSLMLLGSSALAAPARDAQLEEMTIDRGLQTLVEMVLGAAALGDVAGLEENLPPSQRLLESALSLGIYSGNLPGAEGKQQGVVKISHEDAAACAAMLFAQDDYTPLQASDFPGLTADKNGLAFDLSVQGANPLIGAHIYSTAFDGERVEVKCDLYAHYDSFLQSAQVLPEDALRWLCHGDITLRYAPESAFGYLVESFILSPAYLDGRLSDWQAVENTEFEYSVNIPAILGLAEDAPGHMAWQTADGLVNLSVDVHQEEAPSYEETLSRFMMNNPGLTVTEQREFSQFYAVGEGIYSLLIVSEWLPWSYTLTLTFPAERQAEFTLYAEFIRNSMIVWGLSNG